VGNADAAIRDYAQRELDGGPSGCTVVLAVITDGVVTVGHMGDSRAYLKRGGELRVLTADHSFVGAQVQAGLITAAEARVHPMRSRLTRALGLGDAGAAEVHEHPLEPGDLVLLCSDGLHGLVDDDAIAKTLDADLEGSAKKLVALANKRGGTDNITVAVGVIV
jgi:protein phosphatase